MDGGRNEVTLRPGFPGLDWPLKSVNTSSAEGIGVAGTKPNRVVGLCLPGQWSSGVELQCAGQSPGFPKPQVAPHLAPNQSRSAPLCKGQDCSDLLLDLSGV